MKHISMRLRGFTLIEVLVVVAIIGILASIIYANFGDAKTEAMNTALQSSMKEAQLALELYKAQNGVYPDPASGGGCDACAAPGVSCAQTTGCSSPIVADLIPDFIAALPSPSDSANPNCNITYQTDFARTWYKLTAINCHGGATTAAEGIQPDSEFARCLSAPTCPSCDATYQDTPAFYESYAVYSSGGQCE